MQKGELYWPISDCRMCYGHELREVLGVGEQALTGIFPKSRDTEVPGGPLELVKCGDCGLVQLAHNYDLATLYGDNYGYRSGLNQSMVRHLHGKVKKIESQVSLKAGDLVIDIGSNDSTLLRGYSVSGLRKLGMDPTGEKFRKYYPDDAELIPDFFSAAAVKKLVGDQKARVVTSIAMFYDLERPLDFVSDILEALAEDGLWVFEQSYLPAMVATHSYDTICHEHLEYYTLKQIQYFTSRLGLKIIDVEFNDANGGSFSVTVARESASYPGADDVVARAIAEEEEAGYDTTKPFDDFRSVMTAHRRALRALLRDLKGQGKSVLGYGASTKGNVLLQYCGIDEELLPYIAEVNEDKFGAFTPGTKIPIISELEAREMRPDYFLVLPWHFRDNIVAKEAEFLAQGGSLIFPLPALEVVSS